MESQLIPYETSLPADVPAVLVLAPHPDDEVFGCGGTLALHAQAGCRVHVVVMTHGDLGGQAEVRREESLRAAQELGYEAPQFWGLPDRGVLYGEALIQRIEALLTQCGAQVLYAPSLWENHPDHRAAALAAREAVLRHGQCVLMAYEIGAPLRPNRLIDITHVRDRKHAAMRCFPSQLAMQAYDRQIDALNVFRTYTLQHAGIEAIEAFEFADAQTLRSRGQSFLASEYTRQREDGLMLLPEDTDVVTVMIRSMDRPELDRALSSIAVQTWPRIEVVVVNAKGPGHRALPAWCGRFPLRLVGGDEPLHRSAAANVALSAAQGDSLLFLDDDDWLDADHIAKLASSLASRPDAVAVITGVQGVDAQGERVAEWHGRDGVHRLLLINQMPIMSVLFRRDRLSGARFDVQLDVFEDWDFWLQLAQSGAFVGVPGISASYLIRPFDGSGVHRQAVADEGLARIRRKWRERWPDAWFEKLREELQQIEGRGIGLQTQLEQWQLRGQAAESALEPLRHELLLAQAAQQRAEQHNATMDHLRHVAEQQRATAEHQRATAEHERNTLQQQCATVAHERNLARQQLHDANVELAMERQALQAAEHQQQVIMQQLQEVTQRLGAVLHSRSWRLAAPLRFAGRCVRGWLGR